MVSACAAAALAVIGSASCYNPPAAGGSPPVMSGDPMRMGMSMSERGAQGIKGSLEDDEKVTQNYFLTLGWGDDLPDSAVWEGPWGTDDVRIRLVPASTSPVVAWGNALATDPAKYSGHLVMKIIVLEDRAVADLGLSGLETGYLWIGKRGKNNEKKQGAAIYTLKPNGKAKLAKEMAIVGMCREDHQGRAMAHARPPGQCTEPIPPAALQASHGSLALSSFRTRAGPEPVIPQGLWVTCPGGCCEVSSVEGGPG